MISRFHSLTRAWHTLIVTITVTFFCACSNENTSFGPDHERFETLQDFNGHDIATLTGSAYETMLKNDFKDLRWHYYDDLPSIIPALKKGDVDALVTDSPVAALLASQYPEDLAQFPELVRDCDYAAFVKKGNPLREPISQFIREWKADGTIEKMEQKWFSANDSIMRIDWSKYNIQERPNGTLRLAFDVSCVPMAYIGADGKPCGMEIEFILMIADKLDMGVKFSTTKVSSLILYINQDKADIGVSSLIVTPERQESVDFCESYYSGGVSLLCRQSDIVLPPVYSPKAVIATEVGTTAEAAIKKTFPNAHYKVVSNVSEGFLAVSGKKAKAFATDKGAFETYQQTGGQGLRIYKDSTYGAMTKIAVGVSPLTKIPDAENKINAFIQEMHTKGIFQDMEYRWIYQHNYQMPKIDRPANPQYTIRIGTSGLREPYTFYYGNEIIGFDIEMMQRFALWCNAELVIETHDWSDLIGVCAAGKVDYAAACLFDTPERRESIHFSKPYNTEETVLIVADEESHLTHQKSFIQKVSESFEKTFIRENRWEMIVKGLLITLWITLGAGIIGTLLGFLLCLGIRSRHAFICGPSKIFATLMQGIPSLVILMITYFVIFGKAEINPIWVGVIAFGVMFAVAVAGILNTGIDAIDRGQWEAATALGFGRYGTFGHIILPQAVRHVLPLYKSEFVSMMKLTSIAGYISIEDLTKVGDIIRSRTYEAFFPLIAIAIIYFLLSGLITYALGRIEVATDPKRKPRKLPKGIRTDISPSAMDTQNGDKKICDEELIHLEHLKKVYPNATPLKDVNASIHRGEVITIIGPSGTGKSTLMRCINRLETPTEGKITVFGMDTSDKKTDLKLLRRRAGMVFQSFNLFSHLTVIENIMLAPTLLNREDKQKAYENAIRLLRRVGMAEKALNYPDELSGGQKQRVAIARAMAMNPEIIFFDEPTSALDPTMVGEVLSVIKSLAQQGLTMMIVTHEMKFARNVSTRIFYMDQGLIYEDGTPAQIFDAPQKDRTRRFIQRLKVLEVQIESQDFDFISINSRIMQYGLKNSIDLKTIFRMQNIFEELCVQLILPKLQDPIYLKALWEYSEESGQIQMNIRYNGPEFDPLESGDELSVMMLRGFCSDLDYHFDTDDSACGNEIRLSLKQ